MADADRDLAAEPPVHTGGDQNTGAKTQFLEPPALSEDNFKQKYPSAEAMTVVTLNMGNGQNISCTLVGNKVFLSTGSKVTIFGAGTTNAKPLFMYAGGTWISEDAKASKEKSFKHVLFRSVKRKVLKLQEHVKTPC